MEAPFALPENFEEGVMTDDANNTIIISILRLIREP
jgi:hypothetical protein